MNKQVEAFLVGPDRHDGDVAASDTSKDENWSEDPFLFSKLTLPISCRISIGRLRMFTCAMALRDG